MVTQRWGEGEDMKLLIINNFKLNVFTFIKEKNRFFDYKTIISFISIIKNRLKIYVL